MSLPKTLIEFAKKQAETLAERAEKGTLVIPIISVDKKGVFSLSSETEIETKLPVGINPLDLSNIKRAFIGSVNKPNKVIVVISDTIENVLKSAALIRFNYIVPHIGATVDEVKKYESFIKDTRDVKKVKIRGVLPSIASDHEGIINFTTDNIKVGSTVYKTNDYCSRIAGLILGLPPQQSSTFKFLNEVTSVDSFTNEEMDTKIENGEFIIYHDGIRVKVGSGVTSLKTVSGNKNSDMKYIKLMDSMDMIYSDLRILVDDHYIGNFANDYDSKLNLMNAIDAYFEELKKQRVIKEGYKIDLDLDSIITYLKANNKYVDGMKEKDIKQANTGTNVYIKVEIELINSIEDVKVTILT